MKNDRVSLFISVPEGLAEKLAKVPSSAWESFVDKAFEDAVKNRLSFYTGGPAEEDSPNRKERPRRRPEVRKPKTFGDSSADHGAFEDDWKPAKTIRMGYPVKLDKPIKSLKDAKPGKPGKQERDITRVHLDYKCPFGAKEGRDHDCPYGESTPLVIDGKGSRLIALGVDEEDLSVPVKKALEAVVDSGDPDMVAAFIEFLYENDLI